MLFFLSISSIDVASSSQYPHLIASEVVNVRTFEESTNPGTIMR